MLFHVHFQSPCRCVFSNNRKKMYSVGSIVLEIAYSRANVVTKQQRQEMYCVGSIVLEMPN